MNQRMHNKGISFMDVLNKVGSRWLILTACIKAFLDECYLNFNSLIDTKFKTIENYDVYLSYGVAISPIFAAILFVTIY